MSPQTQMRPLAVDLDGTLIRSDVLFESAAKLIRRQPWTIFQMPVWLTGGKARMKREIAQRVSLDPALLPYNEEFLEWLKEQHRTRVLATASDYLLAESIAKHLEIFDDVIGSDGTTNQKGSGKLSTLQARYGRDFAYAGNSSSDLAIWRGCDEAIVVNANPSTARAARALGNVREQFPNVPVTYAMVRHVVRGRACQLILLCSVPLALITNNTLWEFAGFAACFLIAGLFITRDVLSLESHRRDRRLSKEPIANGTFPISMAFFLGPALLLIGLALFAYMAARSAG